MDVLQNQLDCNRCPFHGSDYKSTQIHMGTIHPEFCEEIDTGGLGKLVFYQKSARLFHCHKCFFTSKMFANVYNHILDRHALPIKWNSETKPVEPKSEPVSDIESDKNDSESVASEDDKYVDEHNENKVTDPVKSEENDTLTSWPEKPPSRDNHDNSDSDFKSSSIEKASEISTETKDKESSSDPDLPDSESSSSSSSSNIQKASFVKVKGVKEFSDNETSSPSKDVPEFSDDEDEEPALPGGIPHFSEDDEVVPEAKDEEESSDDDALPGPIGGIEDISEDEIAPEEKPTGNMSEDEVVPAQSKELESSSEDEEPVSTICKDIEFSEDEEDEVPVIPKDIMDFSEDEEEESANIPKNAMDFSDEEETANATKNIMEFSEEEDTTNVSKHIMEFSEEGTSGLSKDIMEFSEDEEDTPAISKCIMEFSDEDDVLPQSKNMPKYLEGNSTPTQSKDSDYAEDVHASALKGSSPFSDDDETPDESTTDHKTFASTPGNLNTPPQVPGVLHVSEFKGTPWSKDRLETINTSDISPALHDTSEASDDKDGFLKEEEILKHVKRVKGRFHCLLCDCRPLKRGPILHHLITRHNMPSPFVCKTCGKTFVMETHLKNHLASHFKGLYKCHRCNFQTDHARGFKKHQTHCENRHKEEAMKPVLDFQDIHEDVSEED
ncbi:chromosome alignment-maintaining phosphoprotein 1 [Hyperolius riggenbachi]|uniref:chromosome alignment-maintaining phosphoprotein 1 n=1 Tax=Hyperolius riggenbachi TaxID=752182 RepID=UPI0035A2E15C